MTSSLVGSEMCIRDSLRSQYISLLDLKTASGTLLTEPKGVAWGWLLASVSYTHLTLPTICSV
eukprot:4734079-Prorocentrum_lima.AAC.1